jgi:hypothetical protein
MAGSNIQIMQRLNLLLSEFIIMVLLVGAIGCAMTMGPPNGMPGMMERPGEMSEPNFKKSFSVVYHIDYDEESFPYITIYYNVPYSGIIFLKEDSLYKASFRLNVNITSGDETIVNKVIPESITVKDYSKTVSPNESFFGTFKENISTGKNEVSIMLMDKNSNRRYVWKREVSVPEATDTLKQD